MGGVSMEWKEVRLGDVCNLIAGFAFKAKDFGGFPTKVVKIGDIKPPFVDYVGQVGVDISRYDVDKLSKYTVRYGDYVLAMTGATIGKVGKCISEQPSYINQRVLKFSPKQDVDADYINYTICSSIFAKYVVNYIDSESAQPNISAPTISKFVFRIPKKKEDQRRIASILSSLDRKIELNNKINADLEEMAQAIFKNWFVDFEPFKDGKFVDSELGMIPEGWKVGRLTDVIKLMPGGTPKTSEPLYWDNGTIPFFSPKDVNGVYCFATEKHITEAGLNKCSSNLYPKDTIFITCRGTVGKVCLAACDMAMNQSNYAIKAIDGYSQYYVFFLVKSVVERLIKKSNGAVFSAITSKDFDEEILIPSQKAVEDFTNVIDGFFRRFFTIGTENSRLSLLRDTLLPRLMSGEIEVPE